MSIANEKNRTHPGRPSAKEDEEIQERYIKIWSDHFFRKKPIWQLEKDYGFSKKTIKKAITFVNKEFISLPNKIILKGAIFSISERIKKLTEQLEKEYKKNEPSVRNIKELNSEIRNDEIELNKLKSIYQEKYSVTLEGGESVKKILEVLNKQS